MPARPQRMRHVNGTAATAYTKIAVKRGIGQYAKIANLDGTNSLEVSFDGGTNYFTINATDTSLEVNALFHYLFIRSTAGAAYSIIIGEG